MTLNESRLEEALDRLSAPQRRAIEHPGNFSLLARPGSGKTRTVALRLAREIQLGQKRVAVASYTNVAVDEVLAVCDSVGIVAGPRHYVGTLHGFLSQYVLQPNSHMIRSARGPMLVRDAEWAGWRKVMIGEPSTAPAGVATDEKKKLPVCVADFHLDRTGKAICHSSPEAFPGLDPAKATRLGHKQAHDFKRSHARQGYLSQSDILYWSLDVLRRSPRIARALAGRFDELIVDEAQDTSDVQVACLELLRDTGRLKSLVVVADLEQSIYGFQGADPERFAAFASKSQLEPLELKQNFRSSTLICRAASGFTRRDADEAVGENADCPIRPEVLRYEDDNPAAVIVALRQRLEVHDLPLNDAVVLARSRKMRDKLNEVERVSCNRVVRALGNAAAVRERGRPLGATEIRAVEEALLWMIAGERELVDLDVERRRRLRRLSAETWRALPRFGELTLADWVSQSRVVVSDLLDGFVHAGTELKHPPSQQLKNLKSQRLLLARSQFVVNSVELEARTVHSVKGRSIDSVLLVVEPATSRRDRARVLCSVDEHGTLSPEEREELRIGFVSVTRAERYCAVALPDSVPEDVLQRYLKMGFVAVG
ncbi:ATP-dependent helicase [Solirubrobacter taibaiensis]|nr:ATP-dependent helicase [Solirubrobacter taibaiensis]